MSREGSEEPVHMCCLASAFAACLTHISLASFCGTLENSADSDQNAVSDQGLHCLPTDLIKNEKYHLTTLRMEMDWFN